MFQAALDIGSLAGEVIFGYLVGSLLREAIKALRAYTRSVK